MEWGPEGYPRTALFQWSRALEAHERIKRAGKPADTERVPGLHERLARAWQATSQPAKAFAELQAAAEGYLELRRLDAAQSVLSQARSLSEADPSLDAAHLRVLEARLREVSG